MTREILNAPIEAVKFVISRLAIRAWSEMPGNPNQGIDNIHHDIRPMAAIHYLRTPEEPEDLVA